MPEKKGWSARSPTAKTRYDILWTIDGMFWAVTSTVRSAFLGVSYSTSTPTKPLMVPFLACAYTPRLSVLSQCARGVATWTRKKFPPAPALDTTVSLTSALERSSGATGEAMTAAPARASSLETKAIRCRLSCRSSEVNDLGFRSSLIASPSSRETLLPPCSFNAT